MALLENEQAALEQLEQSVTDFYIIVVGDDLEIDKTKTVEERLLALSKLIDDVI